MFNIDPRYCDLHNCCSGWGFAADATPHLDCQDTRELIKNLIGLTIDKGIRRKLQSAVGMENGCTHLFELSLECIKGLIQAKYSLMNLTMPSEQVNAYVEEYLKDSCYHYGSN